MKSVAVIFGGRSAEHDVSIITAHIPIINTLVVSGEYDIWPIYISREGRWYSDKAMNDLAFFKHPGYEAKLQKPISLSLNDGLTILWPGSFGGKSQKIDIVFPSMHGTYGEDGSLMGLLLCQRPVYWLRHIRLGGCDGQGADEASRRSRRLADSPVRMVYERRMAEELGHFSRKDRKIALASVR